MNNVTSNTPLQAMLAEVDDDARLTPDAALLAKALLDAISEPCGHVPGYGVLSAKTVISLTFALIGADNVSRIASILLSETEA